MGKNPQSKMRKELAPEGRAASQQKSGLVSRSPGFYASPPSALPAHPGEAILHLGASFGIAIKNSDATQFPANTWLVFLFAC